MMENKDINGVHFEYLYLSHGEVRTFVPESMPLYSIRMLVILKLSWNKER